MPLCEGREHQPALVLPPSIKSPEDEVLLIRFTGEVFESYEDYNKALNAYRQRIWSCKYTGEAGLTYEEAVASEHQVDKVVKQFPSQYEGAAARIVHHSLKPVDALASAVAAASQSPTSDKDLAARWINAVAVADPVTGVSGVDCVWRLLDYFRLKYQLPESLPPELAERLRPARHKTTHRATSATPATPAVDGDTLPASIDGTDYVPGDGLTADDEAIAMLLDEGEAGAGGGAAGSGGGGAGDAGAYDEVMSDWEDDDYKPTRFAVDDLPWRARGRGRGGRGRGGRGRGRGRGRWGRGRGGEELLLEGGGTTADLASSPAAAAYGGTAPGTGGDTAGSMELPSPVQIDVAVESLEMTEKRMTPGSIKHGVLVLLKEVGEAGMTINELANEMQKRRLKSWDEQRQARNSIASTCGHDPAFIRIAPGRFAIRALLSPEALRAMSLSLTTRGSGAIGSGGAGGDAASRQLAVVEAQQAEAMRRLAESQSKVDHNNFKCSKCHRVVHSEASPLVLCDNCPRSFHLGCLEMGWSELPTGDWRCPKCIEASQQAVRRLMDLETRKKEAIERAAIRKKADEERLLKRLLTKGEGGGAGAGGGGAGGGGKDAARQARRVLDDWEALEEEKKHLASLKMRMHELQEIVNRTSGVAVGGGGAVPQGAPAPAPMAEEAAPETEGEGPPSQGEQQQQEEGGGGGLEERKTRASSSMHRYSSVGGGAAADGATLPDAAVRMAETAEAIKRLELILQGPSDFHPLLTDQSSIAALNEAATVAEFLALYGGACEVHKELTAQELILAAAWPLDHADDLSQLYSQLLLCCLLEQLNWDPPTKGRASRWTRVLTDSTWPEILRRYLLHRAAAAAAAAAQANGAGEGDEDTFGGADEGDDKDTSASPLRPSVHHTRITGPFPVAAAADGDGDSDADVSGDPLTMDDRQLALHCASLLGRGAWWELPGAAHLRLLGMLCYDIAQGVTLREDINTRLADCTKITTDWGKELAVQRRRKRAAETAADGSGKRRRGSNKKSAAAAAALVAEEESERDGVNADGADDDNEEETEDAAEARRAREAQVDAQLAESAFRTLPLGQDRHDRRYWWLRGVHGHVMVETTEGQHAGTVSNKEALDDLLLKLNRRGPKEQVLYNNLRRRYDDIITSFEEAPSPEELQLTGIQRPVPSDGRHRQKDLRTLASLATGSTLTDCKNKLEGFLTETQEIGVPLGVELKALRRDLRACETPAQLCNYLLQIEAVFCDAGEGLPVGATVEAVASLIGEEDAVGLPEIVHPPGIEEPPAAAASAAVVEGEDSKMEIAVDANVNGDATAAVAVVATNALEVLPKVEGAEAANGHVVVEPKQESVAAEPEKKKEEPIDIDAPAPNAAPDPAADASQDEEQTNNGDIDDEGTQTHTQTPTQQDEVEAPRPVTADDDLDDSDAEHAYLREKRMRRPARLWRSVRERATWIKYIRSASRSADGVAAVQGAFASYLLCDRAGPMLQRFITLAQEAAKWEEEEKVRAKAEAAKPAPPAAKAQGPVERPLMIRTGKAKTDDGIKVVLKAMGKEPFPQGRQVGSIDSLAPETDVASCRWGYQCSVCLLAGDLLCCEHPDGCAVSVHADCTGHPFPVGPWICTNHDDRRLKTRIRKGRGSSGRGSGMGAFDDGGDSEATISDFEEGGDVDSDATEEYRGGGSSRRRRK